MPRTFADSFAAREMISQPRVLGAEVRWLVCINETPFLSSLEYKKANWQM